MLGRSAMTPNVTNTTRPVRRDSVIALHCSGAGATQWCHLAEALGGRYQVLAPEHYGCESTGPWSGEHAFTIADEAARAIALLDGLEGKVHLVGHSYGGAVALGVALARPQRIASMALYEPAAFYLLRQMGERGAAADAEITTVARRICEGVVTGDYHGAMAAFVDYWNGPGAWAAMGSSLRSALVRWAPKAPLDFRALIGEPTLADAFRELRLPVLIVRGEHAPAPTRLIAERLSELLPAGRLITLAGAGHMGPLTHAADVSALIVQHISAAEAEAQPHRWRPRGRADIFPKLASSSREAAS